MEEKLEEQVKGPSLEKIKKVVEELKKATAGLKKDNLPAEVLQPAIQKKEKIIPEIKFAEIKTELSDLTQERLKLEKILQEINNLKGRICQRIGLLKMLEKGKKEIERTPNLLEEVKNKLDNLRGHIK